MKKRYFISLIFSCFYLSLLAPNAKAQYSLEDHWPNLRFRLPVAMHTAPDNSKRIFVIEQAGRIKVFKDSGTVGANDTTTFFDIVAKVPTGIGPGNEYGLLGMAFHPNFTNNGYVFINYTRPQPLTTYVSRFKLDSSNINKLNPASEKVILKVVQPYANHNGGSIIFGDDGYLYIGMGDGGSGGDPSNRAQNKSELLGKILRIDVDVPIDDSAYVIPPTNPFFNNTNTWKKEIGVWGMRNPWKITKDPDGPTIWIGDVGQNAIEEVDTFRLGANYGWRILEGNTSYGVCGSCDTSNLEPPVYSYARNAGNCVTGGYVYRGTELAPHFGAYVYGDYGGRNVWTLQKDASGVYKNKFLLTHNASISSFGLDYDKEVYVVSYTSTTGRLLKLRCALATPVLVSPPKTKVCIGDSIVLLAPTTGSPTGYRWSTGDTTNRIVLRNPGDYSISVKTRSSLGCYSYNSNVLNLRVVTPPLAPIIPNVSLCNGDSTEVSLPSSLFYKWSDGSSGNQFSVHQSGPYWVIASDSVGCKSDTGFFNANFEALPSTPNVMQTGPNTLKADSLSNGIYTWLLDGSLLTTTSTPSLAINQSGVYKVILVSAQGCKSDTSEPFNATVLVSTKGSLTESVSVSPNPFRDQIEVSLNPGLTGNGKIELYSLDGKLLKSIQLNSTLVFCQIPSADLPKGTYVLKVSTEKVKKSLRLVKE